MRSADPDRDRIDTTGGAETAVGVGFIAEIPVIDAAIADASIDFGAVGAGTDTVTADRAGAETRGFITTADGFIAAAGWAIPIPVGAAAIVAVAAVANVEADVGIAAEASVAATATTCFGAAATCWGTIAAAAAAAAPGGGGGPVCSTATVDEEEALAVLTT